MVGRVTPCAPLSKIGIGVQRTARPTECSYALVCSYENRTSLPGSISKSSTSESSVLGLITSSTNFT